MNFRASSSSGTPAVCQDSSCFLSYLWFLSRLAGFFKLPLALAPLHSASTHHAFSPWFFKLHLQPLALLQAAVLIMLSLLPLPPLQAAMVLQASSPASGASPGCHDAMTFRRTYKTSPYKTAKCLRSEGLLNKTSAQPNVLATKHLCKKTSPVCIMPARNLYWADMKYTGLKLVQQKIL